MKIALINENSQAAKNALICQTLKKVVEPLGHEVHNYGMYSAEDKEQLTYVQIGILSAVLLHCIRPSSKSPVYNQELHGTETYCSQGRELVSAW